MFKRYYLPIFIFLSFSILSTNLYADQIHLRNAKIKASIFKKTYVGHNDGRMGFTTSEVCTKDSTINVYKNSSDDISFENEDFNLIRCSSNLLGQSISVTLNGLVTISPSLDQDSTTDQKRTFLFLSSGKEGQEIPQLSTSSWTENWFKISFILSPVVTGKISDGVTKEPEVKEFFYSVISIDDSFQ